ncbi:MAG: hypothetical protein V1872_08140 [bacterium]
MEEQEKILIEGRVKIENQVKAGTSWFFWIAGLSLVNSIILLSGGNWNFVIGLGVTQIIDTLGIQLAEKIGIIGNVIAFIFDIGAAGIFILFGIFSKKKYSWAFIVGMGLYAFDGLLFLLAKDLLSIGFHIFALSCIWSGFKANKLLTKTENSNIIPNYQPVIGEQKSSA